MNDTMNKPEINFVKTTEVDIELLSPAMQQYVTLKREHPDCIILYRLGDFFETFFEDAVTMSKLLDLTLTARAAGEAVGKVPLAGIPYKSANSYIDKLIQQGKKVVVCDQLEDPKEAKGKLVERGITRILTSGTMLSEDYLDKKSNNYICALFNDEKANVWGFAYTDVTTGEFKVTQGDLTLINSELTRIKPAEIIGPSKRGEIKPFQIVPDEIINLPENIVKNYNCSKIPESVFEPNFSYKNLVALFNSNSLEAFGYSKYKSGFTAAGALVAYIHENMHGEIPKYERIESYELSEFMIIDPSTRKNLELTETLHDKGKYGSLLWAVDYTKTNMGARLLKNWLCQPLKNVEDIQTRQRIISDMVSKPQLCYDIALCLDKVYDIQRLANKIGNGTVNPRDFLSLKNSLLVLPELLSLTQQLEKNPFESVFEYIDNIIEFAKLIDRTINENAPILIKEGGIIKDGVNGELDYIKDLLTGGEDWLVKFEESEREKTGRRTLKVGYKRVFGYYSEVSNSFKNDVPKYYVRKQTLTTGERFITDELKKHEDDVLSAKFKSTELEYKIFCDLREYAKEYVSKLREISDCVAKADVFTGLAICATENNYCCPIVDNSDDFIVKNGRHPVLEKILPMGEYVANDLELQANSNDKTQFMILTGPNMAGKSTFMRQNGLICILAQIGSWVPAQYCKVGIVDRIFTRVGASDDLTLGQSTFMVEMIETSTILNSATPKSFILIDEIGRGTSTYDGVAIAWSVAEYIANKLKSRCIFATHFHELNVMTKIYPQMKNYRITVSEENGDIKFLRKIVQGGASRSYGIEVAKIAGLPAPVIKRSMELMTKLQKDFSNDLTARKKSSTPELTVPQLTLFYE